MYRRRRRAIAAFNSEQLSARGQALTHQNSLRKDRVCLVLEIFLERGESQHPAVQVDFSHDAQGRNSVLFADVTAQLCGGHSGSTALPVSFPTIPIMSHRKLHLKRDDISHLAADAFTHAHDRLQAARTKIHSREEKKQGTVGLLSARVPPPSKNMRASALRSAFFTSNQIPFCARHSSFISRMCFWSSTNMSQCDTTRRFTQRPSQLTCARQSFAFFGRKFVPLEVPVLSPLFVLHHASGGPSWKNRPPRMCELWIMHPAGVSPHQGGLKLSDAR